MNTILSPAPTPMGVGGMNSPKSPHFNLHPSREAGATTRYACGEIYAILIYGESGERLAEAGDEIVREQRGRGGVCGPRGGASARRLHRDCPAARPRPPRGASPASTFIATVERIAYSPLVNSDLNWIIDLKVERVLSGPSPGETFFFRVRNPTRQGIEVGRSFQIRAVPSGRHYRVDQFERAAHPGNAAGAPLRSAR